MALVDCPDCGTALSEKAVMCVRCGRPMMEAAVAPAPVVHMHESDEPRVVYAKRTFNSVLGLAWLLGFGGCAACSSNHHATVWLYGLAFLTWVVSRFYRY